MDKLMIKGPCQLKGSVAISASKNSTLPIMTATLLFPFKESFTNLPGLRDVTAMLELVSSHGAIISEENNCTSIDATEINNLEAHYDIVRKMRASMLVLGPLLTRFGEAKVSLPGGCAIGTRPIDLHLTGLKEMGAEIVIENGYIYAKAKKLKGVKHELLFPSVGATENLMMAAVYAEGTTTLENVAREPEIVDLANYLRAHGVKIRGEGTHTIEIEGTTVDAVKPLDEPYQIIGDRIEAATFIIAALMTKSEIEITDFDPLHLDAVIQVLKKAGAKFELKENGIQIFRSELDVTSIQIDTAPFPGFPTDVQAQMMALLCVSKGSSLITEHIFENRFMHVPELARMGAKITLRGNSAFIEGVERLSSAPVMCTDLRASATLVLAALVADGETEIRRIYHLDRGYENIDQKLRSLGVTITRGKE
jgi:UDP-N-acetylglucosamine 1-carboxyvinyltransferase